MRCYFQLNWPKRALVLLFGAFAVLQMAFWLSSQIIPGNSGDGDEYIITAASIKTVGFPCFSPMDLKPIQESLKGSDEQFSRFRLQQLHDSSDFTALRVTPFTKSNEGLACSNHFWFYSSVLVIMKALNSFSDQFSSTAIGLNWAILFLILVFPVLIAETHQYRKGIVLGISFLLSGALYYRSWIHPEVLQLGLIFIGCSILFLKHGIFRLYVFAILVGTASLQNSTVTPILLLLFLKQGEAHQRLRWHPFGALLLGGGIAGIPVIWSMHQFSVPNILMELGFINPQRVAVAKLWDRFFDLNQGLIVGVPGVFVALVIWRVSLIFRRKRLSDNENWNWKILWLATLLMASLVSMQVQVTAGCAVMERYLLWTVIPLIFGIFILQTKVRRLVIGSFLLIQTLAVFYWWNVEVEDSLKTTAISRYFYSRMPSFYNPEPRVFAARFLGSDREDQRKVLPLTVIFNNFATKILVSRETFQLANQRICGDAEVFDLVKMKPVEWGRIAFKSDFAEFYLNGRFECRKNGFKVPFAMIERKRSFMLIDSDGS